MAKFLTDLNTRIDAKREADLQAYMAPRLQELKALDPILQEMGLTPVVRQKGNVVFLTFEDATNERQSMMHFEFPAKDIAKSSTARWADALFDISPVNVLNVGDNGWTYYERNYADIRTFEGYVVDDIIEELRQFLPTNEVLLKNGGPGHTRNYNFAFLYGDVKEVLNEIGGGPVIAERRHDEIHGSVEMLVFSDADGRSYHLEFLSEHNAVLREDGSSVSGGSKERRSKLKDHILAIQAGSILALK